MAHPGAHPLGSPPGAGTIIECLHTFCRACIMRHFRESQVCPTCDSNLGTNPRDLVRTDRTLQSIVDKVRLRVRVTVRVGIRVRVG